MNRCSDCDLAVTIKHYLAEDTNVPVLWQTQETPNDAFLHAVNSQNPTPFCSRFAREIRWVRAIRGSNPIPDVKLIYMSHPVSGNFVANIRQAKWWLIWAQENVPRLLKSPCVVIAPWLAEARPEIDIDPETREKFMDRCLAIVRRCDSFLIVGGHIQNGGKMEMEEAQKYKKQIINLLYLGDIPPAVG